MSINPCYPTHDLRRNSGLVDKQAAAGAPSRSVETFVHNHLPSVAADADRGSSSRPRRWPPRPDKC